MLFKPVTAAAAALVACASSVLALSITYPVEGTVWWTRSAPTITWTYDPLLDPGAFLVVLEYSGLNNITVEVVAGDAGNCTLPPDIALGTMGLSRINLVSVPSLKNNWSSRVLAQSPFVQVTPYSRVYPSLTSASEASSASETAPASSTAPPPASGITGKNNKTKTTKTRKTKTLVPMPMGHNV